MRIWDIHPNRLCRQHLLGEHRELHALWSILEGNKPGYRNHPETQRWVGKLSALHARHEALVAEMAQRGYLHHSPLPHPPTDNATQAELLQSYDEQLAILKQKPCPCPFDSL